MSQNKVNEEQLKNLIKKIENNDFNFYFFTLDTKGNPSGSIANIYEHVKMLNDLGYKATILHEKNDYKRFADVDYDGIDSWLGIDYANLPHLSIESGAINVSPSDFLIIPEAFSSIMSQKEILNFRCKKIVLSQSPELMFELLPLGRRWTDFGFNDVITTSNKQAEYLKKHFQSINTHVVPVSIPKYFKPSEKPKQPVIAINCRNQNDVLKITKSFYLQYPMYKWVTFKEFRAMSKPKFAEELGKCFLSVWVDDIAGFGTFPIESMKCKTPVIGKIPNTIPEWMEINNSDNNTTTLNNNGVWVNSTIDIPELIATFLKLWLEDSTPEDLLESMGKTSLLYNESDQFDKIKEVYGDLVQKRIDEINNILSTIKVEA